MCVCVCVGGGGGGGEEIASQIVIFLRVPSTFCAPPPETPSRLCVCIRKIIIRQSDNSVVLLFLFFLFRIYFEQLPLTSSSPPSPPSPPPSSCTPAVLLLATLIIAFRHLPPGKKDVVNQCFSLTTTSKDSINSYVNITTNYAF